MGLFDFGKKEDNFQQNSVDLSVPPVDKVIAMKQQGLMNDQIIQILQKEGYDSNMIFEAMNQADIKSGVGFSQPQQNSFADSSGNFNNNPNQIDDISNPMQPMQQTNQGPLPDIPQDNAAQQSQEFQQQMQYPPEQPQEDAVTEKIEEIAEAIIDEKWNEIVISINKIIDWKDKIEEKMIQFEQKQEDLKKDFENLSKAILGKVNQYDKHLVDVGTEIKAMEKVFQKILPTFTENISELDRLTNELKKAKEKGRK